MKATEFAYFRSKLGKTQKQMAQLLGTSIKAIHSYEQGWRTIPPHAERQLLFILSRKIKRQKKIICWKEKNCPNENKLKCPAWEFKAGSLCWFINGTICDGKVRSDWNEKMALCKSCTIFQTLLEAIDNE